MQQTLTESPPQEGEREGKQASMGVQKMYLNKVHTMQIHSLIYDREAFSSLTGRKKHGGKEKDCKSEGGK